MIFITIGSQEPFDRLVKMIDEIAPSLDNEIIAQVFGCKCDLKNIKPVEFISPVDYNNYISKADFIIAHAGMGTILSALQMNKPLIVVPRLAKYHETRSDHQLETAKRFEELNYVYVAYDEEQLKTKIEDVIKSGYEPLHKIGSYASTGLIKSLQTFINQNNKLKSLKVYEQPV